MFWKRYIVLMSHLILLTGCWDKIEHVSDCQKDLGQDASVMGQDTGENTNSDTGNNAKTKPDASIGLEGWDGISQPCTIDDDCTGYGYEGAKCVKSSILGVVNVPGGYCTACCNKAHVHCAPGVQCIGIDDVYLICAKQCTADEDCRQDDNYVCRDLAPWGLVDFPETFCLPDNEYATPDTDQEQDELGCDWPWI